MIGFSTSKDTRTWAWVGVDPGLQGALAVLRDGAEPLTMKMPLTKRDGSQVPCVRQLIATLSSWQEDHRLICAIEAPFLIRSQRGNLTIGKSWGLVMAAFHILDLPLEIVDPKDWQGIVLDGIIGTDPKVRAAEYVARTFPQANLRVQKKSAKDHDGIIDALCIADWLRRRTGGGK